MQKIRYALALTAITSIGRRDELCVIVLNTSIVQLGVRGVGAKTGEGEQLEPSPGGACTLGFLSHEPVTVYSPHLWFVVFFFPEDCECAHVPVPHGRLNRL